MEQELTKEQAEEALKEISLAFTKEGKPCFAGNLLICHCDNETGKQTGLKEEDISLIYKHIVEVGNSLDPEEPHFKAIKDLEF